MTATQFKTGDQIHGFIVTEITQIPDLQATAIQLEHKQTGAGHIHLAVRDDNNLFSVALRTPPADSTGVAHILEHTVLCGSRRFPVRDPFFSMIKRSLSTFMNALTADDWTMYPFSSRNRKDFYNLMDVYLDAVFFPNLREIDFMQEGHRIEFDASGEQESALLVYKGIVYNEMKGAMSDPRSLLGQHLAKALFPTSTYGYNSGGDPSEIPNLSWQALKDFHSRFYHPSNARFFTYGDMPLENHLRTINETVLSQFSKLSIDVESAVTSEPVFTEPRYIKQAYPVALAPGEDLSTVKKSMVQVAWRASSIIEGFEVMSLKLLSLLLLGTSAAPLYKALMDSRLGSQIAPGSGYSDDNKDTFFAAGLQGVRQSDTDKISEVILSTLKRLAKEGFPEKRVDAAIHRMEFSSREVSGDHFPYPLNLLFRMIGPWNHGGDPIETLLIDDPIERLKREVASGPFFETLLQRYLIDNPHQVTLVLYPDPELAAMENRETTARLQAVAEKLSPDEKQKVVKQAEELKKSQEESPDLSCLPSLELSDIPVQESPVETTLTIESGLPVQWCDQPTNGITYVVFHLDTSSLPKDLISLVPFFSFAMTQVGAAGMDYTEMAKRIEASTGGIGAAPDIIGDVKNLDIYNQFVEIRAKSLTRNHSAMLGILTDIFKTPDFSDLKRLKTLVGELATSLENSVAQAGHRYAASRAASHLTPAASLRESWNGIKQIQMMKDLAAATEDERKLSELSGKLQDIASILINPQTIKCAITAEEKVFKSLCPPLNAFMESLKTKETEKKSERKRGEGEIERNIGNIQNQSQLTEFWAASVSVSYVASVFKTVFYNHPDSAALMVLAKLLRFGYLHREIREKGGAYGGMASFSPSSGLFSLMSYRDPHLNRTLGVYKDAIDWAVCGGFSKENIKEAVLGVFSDLDSSISPSGKGLLEFRYSQQGLTLEMRQNLRERILKMSRESITEVAQKYFLKNTEVERNYVAAVSSLEALEAARDEAGMEGMEIFRI